MKIHAALFKHIISILKIFENDIQIQNSSTKCIFSSISKNECVYCSYEIQSLSQNQETIIIPFERINLCLTISSIYQDDYFNFIVNFDVLTIKIDVASITFQMPNIDSIIEPLDTCTYIDSVNVTKGHNNAQLIKLPNNFFEIFSYSNEVYYRTIGNQETFTDNELGLTFTNYENSNKTKNNLKKEEEKTIKITYIGLLKLIFQIGAPTLFYKNESPLLYKKGCISVFVA